MVKCVFAFALEWNVWDFPSGKAQDSRTVKLPPRRRHLPS